MRYNNKSGRLGQRRRVRGYIKRRRVIAPYGRELHVSGVRA